MWSNWQIPAFGSLVPQHETNLFTVETFTTVRCNVIPSRWAKTSKKITLKWIIYTVKKPLTSWDFVWLFLNINEKEMALDLNNLRPFFFGVIARSLDETKRRCSTPQFNCVNFSNWSLDGHGASIPKNRRSPFSQIKDWK